MLLFFTLPGKNRPFSCESFSSFVFVPVFSPRVHFSLYHQIGFEDMKKTPKCYKDLMVLEKNTFDITHSLGNMRSNCPLVLNYLKANDHIFHFPPFSDMSMIIWHWIRIFCSCHCKFYPIPTSYEAQIIWHHYKTEGRWYFCQLVLYQTSSSEWLDPQSPWTEDTPEGRNAR